MHNSTTKPSSNGQQMNATSATLENDKQRKKNKKRIVSYSLDVELLHKIRKVAQRQDRYYSSIVSEALKQYIQQQLHNEARNGKGASTG